MLNKILVLNLSLAIAHQIDAAFWHEWEMFRLPGGIQLFNILNIILVALLLACFIPVIQRRKVGFPCSIFIALGSASIFIIHSGFALAGYTEFNLPVSIGIVISSFVVSLLQIAVTFKSRHEFANV